MTKKKEYILTKEDFEKKIINFPKNISKKKFNKIKEKLKRLYFDNVDFVNYYDIQNVPNYFSSLCCINYVLSFHNCKEVCYPNFDKEGRWLGGSLEKSCEHISIKDFLKEPKKEMITDKLINLKFTKVEEYEESKIKIHDLFVEINGTGMNKYNIDKIYPTDKKDEIRLYIAHKVPNNSRYIYYKTKKTRDEDYEKLLKIKG